MRDLIKPFFLNLLAIGGSVTTWLIDHGIGTVCGIAALWASICGARAYTEARKASRAQRIKLQYDTCRECGVDKPEDCPFSDAEKPIHCLRGFSSQLD